MEIPIGSRTAKRGIGFGEGVNHGWGKTTKTQRYEDDFIDRMNRIYRMSRTPDCDEFLKFEIMSCFP